MNQINNLYIYLHLPQNSAIHVSKYTCPMDDMGLCHPQTPNSHVQATRGFLGSNNNQPTKTRVLHGEFHSGLFHKNRNGFHTAEPGFLIAKSRFV